ncbi:lipoprotein signal peptidase [Flavobacteriaceae bacterium]|nr:lipoprotein signal peptidase [Flavobacteriaceae bacterium]MDA8757893.1 lipoprotein signal peptidase [Flavobacteriaceae bacterium]MDA8763150.1 lipoprotein signal peptidase [Flavobacteriaceae bacterium]MDB2314549.1 lipoprotein signal peptidase [Flavobacteriaceae bacterium]
MNLTTAIAIVLVLLLMDQASKFFIKLNYPLSLYGNSAIVDWGFFKLLFVENKGMAMGTKLNDIFPFFSDKTAKLVLTIFRLFAIAGIGYWLWDNIRKQTSNLFRWALCLIFAGALGNILDSVFYGLIFSHSYGQVATLFPEGGGYAPIFQGHVVDMLQFPLVSWNWPDWMPWIGGEHYTFFQYVFNIADTAISIGVGILIVFNKKIFGQQTKENFNQKT